MAQRRPHRDSARLTNVMTGLCHSFAPLAKAKLASTGATNMEKSSAPSSAKTTVHAMGWNRLPSTRCRVKMGKIGGDGDDDGVKDRALDFVRGHSDALGGSLRAVGEAHVAHDVFNQHDRAFHDHAEVQCAERKQVGGNVLSSPDRWRQTAKRTEWSRRR